MSGVRYTPEDVAQGRRDQRTRRLSLRAQELSLLWELAGLGELPEDMRPPGPPRGPSTAYCGQPGDLHPSVAATVGCFAAAELVVTTRVHHQEGLDRRGWHAVKGNVLAGLVGEFTGRKQGGVELSRAPAARLGAELQRLVPDLGREPESQASAAAADRQHATRCPPDLLLAQLRSDPTAHSVRALAAGMRGSFQMVLHSGSRPLVAQLLWLATPAGWVALRPEQNDGEPVIELCPVKVTDLRPEIARLLAGVLA